jgi:hypothetical protein
VSFASDTVKAALAFARSVAEVLKREEATLRESVDLLRFMEQPHEAEDIETTLAALGQLRTEAETRVKDLSVHLAAPEVFEVQPVTYDDSHDADVCDECKGLREAAGLLDCPPSLYVINGGASREEAKP